MGAYSWQKTLVLCVCTVVASAVLGLALLTVSFALPRDAMEEHVRESAPYFQDWHQAHEEYDLTLWEDRFTDALMFLNVVYVPQEQASLLDRALLVYQPEGSQDSATKLLAYLDGERTSSWPYCRYWHGYLVALAPLLMVANYEQIRIVHAVLLVALSILSVVLMHHRRVDWLIAPFVLSLVIIGPATIANTLNYMAPLSIALFGLVAVLWRGEKWVQHGSAPVVFVLFGCLVNYFDLLTYPIVALGLPLVALLAVSRLQGGRAVRLMIAASVAWGFGYFGMWVLKWVLATVLTSVNAFADAASQVEQRSATSSVGFDGSVSNGYVDVAQSVISMYYTRMVLVAGLVFVACVGLQFFAALRTARRTSLPLDSMRKKTSADTGASEGAPSAGADALQPPAPSSEARSVLPFAALLVVSLFPFAWMLVTQNHTFMHHFFTYRIMAVTVFALASIVSFLSLSVRER